MFVVLFLSTFLLALAIAVTVAWATKEPIEAILRHFFAVHLSAAFAKYFQLAIVLVGVTAGTRVRALQDYISAPEYNKQALLAQLTQEFWVMELYRTVVGTIEGILWLVFLFALLVFLVVVIIRRSKLTQLQPAEAHPKPSTPVSGPSNPR
jgi:hypothetical protein